MSWGVGPSPLDRVQREIVLEISKVFFYEEYVYDDDDVNMRCKIMEGCDSRTAALKAQS